MVCFVEVDSYGNIVHVQRNPGIAITPVVNIVGSFRKDTTGRLMSSFGHAMHPPIRITEELFNEMISEVPCPQCKGSDNVTQSCRNCKGEGNVPNKLSNYRFNHMTRTVEGLG